MDLLAKLNAIAAGSQEKQQFKIDKKIDLCKDLNIRKNRTQRERG
jgi:hypothetical protein